MDLSIIIVSFNTREILKNCLKSIVGVRQSGPQTEVIIVDNASSDGSYEMIVKDFPEFKLIVNKTNLGFAKANNVGIKQAQGEYIILLNSDTIIFSDTLSKMYNFMKENPKAGVATCRIELPNGQLDPACHRGFPTPWASLCYFTKLEKFFPKVKLFSGYHKWYKDLKTTHEIDSCSGAFYLVRKKVIESVGLLDEDYFMYGEDLDWSYRIKQKGWKIYYNPEAKIIHHKKQSGRESENKDLKKQTNRHFYETMELFYKKHYQKKYPWLINKLMLLGIKAFKYLG